MQQNEAPAARDIHNLIASAIDKRSVGLNSNRREAEAEAEAEGRREVVGHCCFTSWEVEEPREGRLYA